MNVHFLTEPCLFLIKQEVYFKIDLIVSKKVCAPVHQTVFQPAAVSEPGVIFRESESYWRICDMSVLLCVLNSAFTLCCIVMVI